MFPPLDPFVTATKLLCQQLAWHLEDLELHCDKERPDKSTERQVAWLGCSARLVMLPVFAHMACKPPLCRFGLRSASRITLCIVSHAVLCTCRQEAGHDGVGDRITSLTLRAPCWLFMREKANTRNCFALWLEPGDVYSMTAESRWKWQHAIFLATTPTSRDDCRVSVVFRLLEEYPE